ncbi:hypothetical protein SCB49_02559 [unidentified eubacterium SCB49]|nr:hypothetical protein SCB49_02559 [unidentified eubacterium SCB49]
MTKYAKLIFITLGIFLIAFAVTVFYVNTTVKSKINHFLENRLPPHITSTQGKIDVNTFDGTVTLSDVLVKIKNKNDTLTHTFVTLKKLVVEDVGYWDYIINKKIKVEDIKLKDPNITYYKDKVALKKDTLISPPIKLFKPFLIDELNLENATFTIIQKEKDSLFLQTKNTNIKIDNIEISKETLRNKIPVKYSSYKTTADSIFVKISPYENVTVNSLNIKNNKVSLQDINLKTKYSRKALSKILTKEQDHFNVHFNEIQISEVDFGFKKNRLFIKSPSIIIDTPNASIYRDKLVADDPTIKNLYSKMLRKATIDLTINKVAINNGEISYTERVKEDNSGGTIDFSKINATITNASNTYTAPQKTEIDIKAIFMKDTPFKSQWSFDTNNPNDQFLFKTEIGKMTASDLNLFMKPNLKVALEGTTNKTYLTISGNNNQANIAMRMDYDKFKINILNKNGNKKNKIFSAIANIFIKKNSNESKDDFREGKGTATRDKTKSFFNYVWLNIRAGLISVLTGIGTTDNK